MRRGLQYIFILISLQSCGGPDLEDPVRKFSKEKPCSPVGLAKPGATAVGKVFEGGLPQQLPDVGFDVKSSESPFYYEPNYELWSNGARKVRHAVLPSGSRINTSPGGVWNFPVGSIFFKTFIFNETNGRSRPVETRVLVGRSTGWEVGVYKWENGTATLIPLESSTSVEINSNSDSRFVHRIPSKAHCRGCHESERSFILGFNRLQLDHSLSSAPSTQLEKLCSEGAIDRGQPEKIEAPDESTRAVVGYLYANCSHCHDSRNMIDFRPSSALKQIFQGSALKGPLIVPGEPDKSLLYKAISGTGSLDGVKSMPPIGVQKTDSQFIDFLRTWISSQ